MSQPGQMPHGLYGRLVNSHLDASVLARESLTGQRIVHNLAIRLDRPVVVRVIELGHFDMSLGERDRRTDVQPARVERGKLGLRQVTERVQADNLLVVKPARVRVDRERRLGIGIIGNVGRVEGVQGHGQGSVDRV